MKTSIYTSPHGLLSLMTHQGKLIYCNWISEDCVHKQSAIEKLFKNEPETEEDTGILKETILQLNEYFSGNRFQFDLPINLVGTDFQKKVWRLLSAVPYGTTLSYKEFSNMFGKPEAIRAIAQACGKNPIAIIVPCHRIIASRGKIGGYTGGVHHKIALLALEETY